MLFTLSEQVFSVSFVMENMLSEKLKGEGLLQENEDQAIRSFQQRKLFSLHWEIKTILYLGVVLLSAGAGLIIYQNLDSISHQAILLFLALTCGGCFYYCFKIGPAYDPEFVKSPGLLFDYMLLLGCLLFLSFEGYFQYAYEIFGTSYGLAVLIPALLFFALAYRMDHKGVLSLGITGLAGWMGISASPQDLISGEYEFSEISMVWTGLGFGILIASAAFLLERKNIKKHFSFTYLNFASNVLFVASLTGLFMMEDFYKALFAILLGGFCIAFFLYANKEKSFYFLLLSLVYGYIGITYLFFLGLMEMDSFNEGTVYLGIFYFMGSCGYLIYFLFNYKKILKYDRLS